MTFYLEAVEKVSKLIPGRDAEKSDLIECTTINDLMLAKGQVTPENTVLPGQKDFSYRLVRHKLTKEENYMLFTEAEYKTMREAYCYCDRDCRFEIIATSRLYSNLIGKYVGVFSRTVPQHYSDGVTLRRFELIVQAVFADANRAESDNTVTPAHVANLKEIICAVVHWKMASQGGRANLKVENVKKQWKEDTFKKIISAYRRKELALFKIGGIRIPISTAFLRFLFPNEYGIMDSRVVKITQSNNITQLDLREDGYIIDKKKNIEQYKQKYNPFLLDEARQLNNSGMLFQDVDEQGNPADSQFRPCDIEMALFQKSNVQHAAQEGCGKKSPRPFS